ncbi:MAG: DmsE family decaheme c-type cytochrome [Gemmatimonadetes bacterium]|nr:DmsE family decaheme c-type cytochrome [Gemmatimonadota bacterium]
MVGQVLNRFSCVGTAVMLLAVVATGVAVAQQRPVDWVALNPAFAGATRVNDREQCTPCHTDVMETFTSTRHARAFRHASMPEGGECESCHGPRSKHVEEPNDSLAWSRLTARQQSAVCLQCHEGGARLAFKNGPHLSAEVSCTSCHFVMETRSERALLAKESAPATCYQCHSDVRGQMFKASHHPVREGRMDCASCHNSHGSTRALLTRTTVNDTCVSCHAEKRGPFVWEHAPVRESCLNCHDSHGSNNSNLLTSKGAFLCMQCHSYGGHVNLPRYNRVSSPLASGCVNCHLAPHGSNHPSGAKLTR